jgi:hypothetical protein
MMGESILDKHIEIMRLATRTQNALEAQNVKYVSQLVQMSEQQLLKLRGFGKTALREIIHTLKDHGLCLGMSVTNSPNSSIIEADLRLQVERLKAERDDARRWCCVWEGLVRMNAGLKKCTDAVEVAKRHCWDCFPEEVTDAD